jgi:hypothetical protein
MLCDDLEAIIFWGFQGADDCVVDHFTCDAPKVRGLTGWHINASQRHGNPL